MLVMAVFLYATALTKCCVYTLNTGDLYTKNEQRFENSTGGVYYGTHLPLLITKGKRKSMCMCACLCVCVCMHLSSLPQDAALAVG